MKCNTSTHLTLLLSSCLLFSSCAAAVFLTADLVKSQTEKSKDKKKKQETEQQAPAINTPVGETVSLVVSSTAPTKDLAIRNALRDAIEQTYGTFVSANTTVVNDSLVKDEIATVASGNVLSYKEVSCIQDKDGNYDVTVQAVVSIGRLVDFAKSHGMTTELAGNTFIMNRNLAKLAKENEKKAILNLIEQVKLISSKGLYDFSIKTGEPRMLDDSERNELKTYLNTDEDLFNVAIYLSATKNKNFELLEEVVNNVLSSLCMSREEAENYDKLGMRTHYLDDIAISPINIDPSPFSIKCGNSWFRNSLTNDVDGTNLFGVLQGELCINMINFKVFDNLGNVVYVKFVESPKEDTLWHNSYNYDNRKYNYYDDLLCKLICNSNRIQTKFNGHRFTGRESLFFTQKYDHPGFYLTYKESDLAKLQSISVKSRYNQ